MGLDPIKDKTESLTAPLLPPSLPPKVKKRGGVGGIGDTFSLSWLKMSGSDRDDLEYSLLVTC